tara:strand:+ start:6015 stop:6659 length:645 start_codon:yes stop_codon:yes gene_type:complete
MSVKLRLGVGINDADYAVTKHINTGERYPNGRQKWKIVWTCPYYRKWSHMLQRCYCNKYHKKQPTYKDCTVCIGWLTFSSFRKWMLTQDWEGMELDKDLLIEGNTYYSPETCVFVKKIVNTFTLDRTNDRGDTVIGVTWHKRDNKFMAQCSNPFTKEQEKLGYYDCEQEAHLVWKKRKHDLACQLVTRGYVTDERVKIVLMTKYNNYNVIEEDL